MSASSDDAVPAPLVAVGFLTRVPVRPAPIDDGVLAAATAWFPLVGLLVAGVGIVVRWPLGELVGSAPATVAAVLAMVAVTGAFHEDGLADSADGLWGGWTPPRRIEIMRDSRIGTYGTVALMGALLMRVLLLAPLPLEHFARAVVAGHVVGRAAILLGIRLLPPASDQGSGARVGHPVGGRGLVIAVATSVLAAAATTGWWLWIPLALAVVGAYAVARLADRKLGGMTGDVLGATQQVVLILVLAAVVALVRQGAL